MAGESRGRAAAAQRAQGGGNAPAATGPGAELATRQADPRAATIRTLFQRMAPEMDRALPKHMTVDRMIRVALTVVQENEDLLKCDPRSLLGALMTCTQVGLEPGPQGHVYFVPFWDHKTKAHKVTFIMGYRGIIELARRSGLLLSLTAHTVYSNEVAGANGGKFAVRYGTENELIHHPIVFGERGDAVGYYASARLANPARPDRSEDVFVVLTRDEVERFRQRSATQKAERPSGPWQTDYEAMAWKTCIRRLERWLPQSPELAAALAHEETARDKLDGNVTEQAESVEQEPFDAVEAGRAVGELSQPRQQPPAQDPETGADTTTGELPADPGPVAEDLPDGSWGDQVDPPEPGGPDDPWTDRP